jgi:hypothetical protein
MHAVVGIWEMDPGLREAQSEGLRGIVAGVAELPGVVKGYWSDSSQPDHSHTFIVFEDRESAESFAADVRRNVENQARAGVRNISLDVVAVRAPPDARP